MARQLLNEAERYLLEHWAEARILEEAMEGVRMKYAEVCRRIAATLTETHPELDACAVYPTRGKGSIGFGRKSWPGGESDWPSGFWLWHMRFDMLTAEDSASPYPAIWTPKKNSLDFDAARLRLKQAATTLLSTEELKGVESPDSGQELLWFPELSKQELLRGFADGDGQALVERLVPTFDLMARFVPVLDEVFRECVRKE